MIDLSSKMELKMSCLQTANGDVRKAQELYAFLSEGIESMPDYPVQKPSMIQQAQQSVGALFGWIKENQGDLVQAWNFIQSMRGRATVPIATAAAPTDIPPIPAPK